MIVSLAGADVVGNRFSLPQIFFIVVLRSDYLSN